VGAEEIEDVERRFMDAVRDRDMDALEAMLGERFTLTTGRPGAEVRGRAEWLAVTREPVAYVALAARELQRAELPLPGAAEPASRRPRQA
jgi:hypothetical protein